MSERYSRLFALDENLYAQGSPVVIGAGALLKDNQSGKVLAQLKFRSLDPRIIKGVRVRITPMDMTSQPLGEVVDYQYLDLDAHREQEFGQKSPIYLPDAETREFSVTVSKVVFGDHSVWEADGAPWESLPKPVPMQQAVSDPELQKQIWQEYGYSFVAMPHRDRDLWMCACGKWNHQRETACYHCSQELSRLLAMDMEELKAKRDARLTQEAAQAEQARIEAQVRAKKTKKLASIVVPIAAVVIVAAVLISGSMEKKAAYQEAMTLAQNEKFPEAIAMLEEAGYKDAEDQVYGPLYEEAMKLMEAGDYEAAETGFSKLGYYSDAQKRKQEAHDKAIEARCQAVYEEAEELLAQGETARAAMAFGQIPDYQDAWERSLALWHDITGGHRSISASNHFTVALKADGTVVATGNNNDGQCDVSDWNDITGISAGGFQTVGLKSDGTVVAVGYNEDGQCDVSDWENIAAISSGTDHTVGLRSDGTVVAVGDNGAGQCNISDWNGIMAIATGAFHTVGLKNDGTVVAAGLNEEGQCNVSDWKDIVAVYAGGYHTIGLKADGTVVAVGSNKGGQCDVSNWTNIVEVAAGGSHTVGLKSDGTVVAAGTSKNGQADVADWDNIVQITAGWAYTVGLKSDGTAIAVGYGGDDGRCDVSGWDNIKLP